MVCRENVICFYNLARVIGNWCMGIVLMCVSIVFCVCVCICVHEYVNKLDRILRELKALYHHLGDLPDPLTTFCQITNGGRRFGSLSSCCCWPVLCTSVCWLFGPPTTQQVYYTCRTDLASWRHDYGGGQVTTFCSCCVACELLVLTACARSHCCLCSCCSSSHPHNHGAVTLGSSVSARHHHHHHPLPPPQPWGFLLVLALVLLAGGSPSAF